MALNLAGPLLRPAGPALPARWRQRARAGLGEPSGGRPERRHCWPGGSPRPAAIGHFLVAGCRSPVARRLSPGAARKVVARNERAPPSRAALGDKPNERHKSSNGRKRLTGRRQWPPTVTPGLAGQTNGPSSALARAC